jgi:hypothetical protein
MSYSLSLPNNLRYALVGVLMAAVLGDGWISRYGFSAYSWAVLAISLLGITVLLWNRPGADTPQWQRIALVLLFLLNGVMLVLMTLHSGGFTWFPALVLVAEVLAVIRLLFMRPGIAR